MLKTIRKYNKLILAVGGTLLLISFLIPQAIQQIGQASTGRTIGTIGGRSISAGEYDLAVRELRAVREFYGQLGGFGVGFPLPIDRNESVEHWMLLTREAEMAEMVGGPDEGARLLPVFARQLTRMVYEQQFRERAEQAMAQDPEGVRQTEAEAMTLLSRVKASVSSQARLSEADFNNALAKLQGAVRLVSAYRSAERISDARAVAIARNYGDRVIVDSAFLSARRLADQDATPDDQALRAHFERFRAMRPGEGEFGIGYRLPPRIKLEWIEISRPALREVVRVSLIDATKHWQQSRDRFPGEFDEERARVEEELRSARVDRIFSTAENTVRSAILSAVRPLNQRSGYFELPEDWDQRRPDFIEVAERVVENVRETHGVVMPTPAVYIRDDEWLDGSRLARLPGIGRAQIRFGQQTAQFAQAAMAVRALAGENPLALQLRVPSTDVVAESFDGSRYYFTVLDAAPETVPERIEDLLDPDQVRINTLALRRYQELVDSAETFREAVASEGLQAFADGFGEYTPTSTIEGIEIEPRPRVAVSRGAEVTREATRGLGAAENDAGVIGAVLEQSRRIDPMVPIEEVPMPERIVVAPAPSVLGVVVARIERVQPLTRELLPIYARYAKQKHIEDSFARTIPVPFQLEVLKRRHGFTIQQDREEDAPAPVEPSDAGETEPAAEDA